MLLCWHCDNQLREQTTAALAELARRNLINWLISSILSSLCYNNERELSLGELCWWAVYSGIADAITERMAQHALRLPDEPFYPYIESDIVPMPAKAFCRRRPPAVTAAKLKHGANQEVAYDQPKVLALHADPESPESFMLRPKHRRWVNEDYTRWVKTQPCEGCRRPADDPHHVIGHGMGGTATKVHDLFVILCAESVTTNYMLMLQRSRKTRYPAGAAIPVYESSAGDRRNNKSVIVWSAEHNEFTRTGIYAD